MNIGRKILEFNKGWHFHKNIAETNFFHYEDLDFTSELWGDVIMRKLFSVYPMIVE